MSFALRRVVLAPRAGLRAKSSGGGGGGSVRRSGGDGHRGGNALARSRPRSGLDTWREPSMLDANPFALANRLRDQIERAFEDVLAPMAPGRGAGGGLLGPLGGAFGGLGLPRLDRLEREADRVMERTLGFSQIAVDVAEKADEYVLTAELPGVSKDNLRVDIDEDEGLLTITAEKTVTTETRAPTNGSGSSGASKRGGAGGKKAGESKSATGSGGATTTDAADASSSSSSSVAKTDSGAVAEASDADADVQWHRTERSFGTVSRSLRLPFDADYEKISAKLNNGVLTLHIPKRKGAEPETGRKRINVE